MWAFLIGVIFFIVVAGVEMLIWVVLFNAILCVIVYNSDLLEPNRERLASLIGSIVFGGAAFILISIVFSINSNGAKIVLYLFIVIGQYASIKWLDTKHRKHVNLEEVQQLKDIINDYAKFCVGYNRMLSMYWNNTDQRVNVDMIIFDGKLLKDMFDAASSRGNIEEDMLIKSWWGEYEPSNTKYIVQSIIYNATVINKEDIEYSTQIIADLNSWYAFFNSIKIAYPNAKCAKGGKSFIINFN